MALLYALVWRRDRSPGISWYIRCLAPDGFYGEVHYTPADPQAGGQATGVRGHFTPADRERVAAILAELSAAEPTAPGPCFALLGSYTETVGQSVIVFKYDLGAETSCPQARLFLELHSIIEGYLSEAYSQLTAEVELP
jgi:hypothetical protein